MNSGVYGAKVILGEKGLVGGGRGLEGWMEEGGGPLEGCVWRREGAPGGPDGGVCLEEGGGGGPLDGRMEGCVWRRRE